MTNMTLATPSSTLMIIPSVAIWQVGGALYFDRKFFDGMLAYATYWPGTIRLAIRVATDAPPKFGLVQFNTDSFPIDVVVIQPDAVIDSSVLDGVDIVMASGDSFDAFHLAKISKQRNIKCIYIIEYTLQTRLQIVSINATNIWRKSKSIVWHLLTERKRLQAFRLSDGLQANGVPAYEAYASLVPNALLYFDTRNTAAMGISDSDLELRLSYLDKQAPLRLGFSGRLIEMKGADHLVEVAYWLLKHQVQFIFEIFGDGDLVPKMQELIDEYNLSAYVKLRGAVDYASVLVPFIKQNIDLFVCCHRQGDPSCTYMETYACGVPIVGYDNSAHQGILNTRDVGWAIAINDVEGLADLIAKLDGQREEIKAKARNAARFAQEHTFEVTYQRRISHCIDVVKG